MTTKRDEKKKNQRAQKPIYQLTKSQNLYPQRLNGNAAIKYFLK